MDKPKNLSLRNSKNAISGLHDLCDYLQSSLKELNDIVECGSFSGVSTNIFASYFKHVTAIDMWVSNYDPTEFDLASNPALYDMAEVEQAFDSICEKNQNIKKIKSDSIEASKLFAPESVQVIYIDSLHLYDHVTKELTAWVPKLKTGSFLTGHDYSPGKFPGVVKAITERYGEPDIKFDDSSWAYKVTKELLDKHEEFERNL
jgi:hypothetical protein